MKNFPRTALGGLALMCLAGSVRAELVSAVSSDLPATANFSASTDTLAAALDSVLAAPEANPASALEGRKRALALRVLALPAAAAPSLWSFVSTVQAQQGGSVFVQLDTRLKLVQQVAVPTQVPLPGPLWLLVMGLLGLVGSRLGLSRGAPKPAALPQAA